MLWVNGSFSCLISSWPLLQCVVPCWLRVIAGSCMHVTCGSGSSSSSSSGESVGRFLEKQPLSLFVPWATYLFFDSSLFLLCQSRINQYSLQKTHFHSTTKPFLFIQRLLQFYFTVPPMITFHKLYKLATILFFINCFCCCCVDDGSVVVSCVCRRRIIGGMVLLLSSTLLYCW